MIKRYLRFTVPKWFIWMLIGLVILFISIFAYGVHVYNEIQDSKEAGFDSSKQLVLNETNISKVKAITRYHGEEYYHVVTGITNVGNSAVAFVPVDESEKSISLFLTDEILNKEQALGVWQSKCQACSLIETNMAIKSGHPLLEIKYINNKDRLVFEYISLEDGTTFSTVPLKRSLY